MFCSLCLFLNNHFVYNYPVVLVHVFILFFFVKNGLHHQPNNTTMLTRVNGRLRSALFGTEKEIRQNWTWTNKTKLQNHNTAAHRLGSQRNALTQLDVTLRAYGTDETTTIRLTPNSKLAPARFTRDWERQRVYNHSQVLLFYWSYYWLVAFYVCAIQYFILLN